MFKPYTKNYIFTKHYSDGETLSVRVHVSLTESRSVTATVRTLDGGLILATHGTLFTGWFYNSRMRLVRRYQVITAGGKELDWERSTSSAAERLGSFAIERLLTA